LNNPRFKELAAEYPPFVGALLLSMDPKAQEYDFGALSSLVSEGWYRQKDLDVFHLEVEQKRFWESVEAFYQGHARRVYRKGQQTYEFPSQSHDEKEEALIAKYGEDAEQVKKLKREEMAFLETLRYYHPTLADRLIEYVEDPATGEITKATWRASRNSTGMPHYVVAERLRSFANEKGLQSFEAARGLKAYFEGSGKVTGRDDLFDRMQREGISDINSKSAERLGLTAKYEKLRAFVQEQYPLATTFLNTFLDRDLGGVPNLADEQLKELEVAEPDRYAKYAEFDTDYRALSKRIGDASGDKKFAMLDEQRALVDKLYESDPKLVELWYRSKGFYTRQQHLDGLRTRDPLYFSRYDWQLIGQNVSKQAGHRLARMREWISGVFQDADQAKLEGRDFSVGDQFNAMNAWIKDHWYDKDKSFRGAIDAINTWGWTLEATGLTKRPGKTGRAWKNVVNLVQDFQKAAEANEWLGTTYGSKEDIAIYAQSKEYIEGVVNDYRKHVPAFDRQWRELDNQMFDGDLIDYLVPDDWFGGWGVK
jgi:hypothetical protein